MRWQLNGLVAVTALASASACNLIAGISEGELVDGGAGDASKADASRRPDAGRSGDTGHDATIVKEGGRTADGSANPDGGKDAAEGDAPGDAAGRPPKFACTVVGHPTLVDDLASFDAGPQEYSSRLFIAPTTDGSGSFLVFTQASGESGGFLAYSVALTQGPSIERTELTGTSTTGVTLLDVQTLPNPGLSQPIVALTSYSIHTSMLQGEQGVQMVAIQPAQAPFAISYFLGTIGGGFDDGRIIDVPTNDAGGPLADGGVSIATAMLSHGSLSGAHLLFYGGVPFADAGRVFDPLFGGGDRPTTGSFNGSDIFFATPGDIQTFMTGIGGPDGGDPGDGGYALIAAGGALLDGGPVGITKGPTGGQVIAGHVSASDPTKLLVFVAEDPGGPTASVYAGLVSPSELPGMTLGAPPVFKTGPYNVLPLSTAPMVVQGVAPAGAWHGDDFASVAPDESDEGLVIAWLSPTGRVVVNDTWIQGRSPIGSCALQFDSFFGDDTRAVFDVAWTEHITAADGGMAADRLFAAQVSCVAEAGD